MSTRLLPVLDVAGAIEGREIIGLTIGSREEAIVLAATPTDASVALGRHGEPGWASFADARAKRPYEVSLLIVDGDDVSSRTLAGLTMAHPSVQPLPDGETLVVGSRVRRSAEEQAANAAVYDADGALVREFVLGDGIEDVQTTEDGAIWVSYFDEGVYGNYGWGRPGGARPIGASGLARFDRFGELQWEFEPPSPDLAIDDCLALNVSGDVAWAYYYSSFPLVRIDGNEVEWWDVPVDGACAVAIREESAWLVGGYGNERMRCVVCRFADRQLVEHERFLLATPFGELPETARIAARGESIYALDGTTLYRA